MTQTTTCQTQHISPARRGKEGAADHAAAETVANNNKTNAVAASGDPVKAVAAPRNSDRKRSARSMAASR